MVAPGDAEIDTSFADETRNVGGREEDERNGQIDTQRNVEAGVAVELNVAAGEEVEAGLVETALCAEKSVGKAIELVTNGKDDLLLGTAKRSRSFRLAEMSETI